MQIIKSGAGQGGHPETERSQGETHHVSDESAVTLENFFPLPLMIGIWKTSLLTILGTLSSGEKENAGENRRKL